MVNYPETVEFLKVESWGFEIEREPPFFSSPHLRDRHNTNICFPLFPPNFPSSITIRNMPKVKTNRVKYPEGWELIEPTLRELQGKMREAENDPHDGKRKCETLWPIFKIAHQKSRYVFDLYHRRKEISPELYEFCLDQGYADRNIIAKWKKAGYERLCCLRCIQPRDHNFQTTCVCRVPKHLREEKVIECVHCGCKGCASGD
ncbi:hypothetical protein L1887_19442 [Cichorium endivia]|nr:hypothetical protein L1887_19442 [Cichorium endivia]